MATEQENVGHDEKMVMSAEDFVVGSARQVQKWLESQGIECNDSFLNTLEEERANDASEEGSCADSNHDASDQQHPDP